MLTNNLASAAAGRDDRIRVLNSCKGLKDEFNNIVVGLGNFDGVHIGHQQLIKEVVETAAGIGGTAVICTFNPHPMAVLNPDHAPLLLLSQPSKEGIMAKLGVDVLLVLPFNKEFAKITAEYFIKDILFKELAAKKIVVGYNYSFGRQGQGKVETLEKYAQQYHYEVQVIEPVSISNQVVSSTYIRKLLNQGEVGQASNFLGYPPFVKGCVVIGDGRGNKELGFPTANLNLGEQMLTPANGVYSVKVEINGEFFLGLANVGVKPTFNGHRHRNLEVHLLDFDANIYGEQITVNFLRRLRNERKFSSSDDLVSQINRDIKMVLQDRV